MVWDKIKSIYINFFCLPEIIIKITFLLTANNFTWGWGRLPEVYEAVEQVETSAESDEAEGWIVAEDGQVVL